MDASLISGFSGAINGFISASAAAKDAKTVAASSAAIRAVNNMTLGVENARDAKITALRRWTQQVQNSRVYESVARHQEALEVNFNRSRDARTRGSFAENIRQAEETGRQAAMAAASGVSGSVVDFINQTTELRNNMQDVARLDADHQVVMDKNKASIEQRFAILDGLDNGLIFDNPRALDYASSAPKPTVNPFSAALAGFGTDGLSALGTAVGNWMTPSTGITQAVAPAGGITGASGSSFSFSLPAPTNYFSLGTI